MDQPPKGKVGRPPKGDRVVTIEFKLDRIQADYLLVIAARLGWGATHNEAAKRLIEAEITTLQKASFYARPTPLPE